MTTRARAALGGWRASYALLALLWGCSFVLIATSLRSFAPTQVAWGRIVVGLVLLVGLLALRRERPRIARGLLGHVAVVAAAMTAVPFVLFGLAEQRVTSVLAGLVNATTPLFTAVFVALLVPTERPDRVQVAGLLLGFAGIAVLLGAWDPAAVDVVGGLMLLGATFCYGIGNAWSRRRLTGSGLSPVALPAVQLTLGGLMLTPFLLATPVPAQVDGGAAAALLALGLGGTGAAYILYWRVLEQAGATVTASVTYVIPVVSTTLGVVVLHETLHWYEPVGAVVVLTGVALTQWGVARRRSPVAAAAPAAVASAGAVR
ncbi:DMT family transporter [uncultured Cellulomonas sp.]|uniref:DMT family transporter n=1 Tax=uncultured Cellulomonas sp. TaxID=189682 RepID=UPI0026211DAA|nr:DMT family transporter [uncultured Cellulomonas sp.]